ncbi:hypothetical protein BH23VER1_BH23VER1_33340 [soil metagenome]
MLFRLNDNYFYRMERWRGILTDCSTYSGDSYQAEAGRIEITDAETVFFLDDNRIKSFTNRGLWSY